MGLYPSSVETLRTSQPIVELFRGEPHLQDVFDKSSNRFLLRPSSRVNGKPNDDIRFVSRWRGQAEIPEHMGCASKQLLVSRPGLDVRMLNLTAGVHLNIERGRRHDGAPAFSSVPFARVKVLSQLFDRGVR